MNMKDSEEETAEDEIEGGCRGDGWSGSCRKLYASRPTWRELQEFVRERYRGLWDIVFVMKDSHAMHHVCDYETKQPINYFNRTR